MLYCIAEICQVIAYSSKKNNYSDSVLSITYSQYKQASIENLSQVNWTWAQFPGWIGHGNEDAQSEACTHDP